MTYINWIHNLAVLTWGRGPHNFGDNERRDDVYALLFIMEESL